MTMPIAAFFSSASYQIASEIILKFNKSLSYFSGSNSDTYLHPVAIFPDPFRRGKNKLILCDTYTYDHKPTNTNKRKTCKYFMEKVKV